MMHSRFDTVTGQASPSLVARAARIVRRIWSAYWDWRARHATVQILSSLDARTLHDIGISPSEIRSLAYGQGCQRVRFYDELWRSRSSS